MGRRVVAGIRGQSKQRPAAMVRHILGPKIELRGVRSQIDAKNDYALGNQQ
ncbi:hypothetical protein ACUXAV_005880 [Cupriavidus metallidurans]|jgi:hypothetical protein|nr:hypothetical protein AU374_06038 [Cupriavidus metallidurans]